MMPAADSPQVLQTAEEGAVVLPRHEPLPFPCSFLLSLDYDGTLCCGSDRNPGKAFYDLIRRLRPLGGRWGINTGRTLEEIAQFLTFFELQPDFLCTRERFVYLVDSDGVWHAAEKHNADCYSAQLAMQQRLQSEWEVLLSRLALTRPDGDWHPSQKDPLSIVAKDSETMDALVPTFSELLRAHPDVGMQRASRFMRLTDARFNKGSVLSFVLQHWAVPEERLFIMGDGHNDLDAFAAFPRAFCCAPASAHPEVITWILNHGGSVFPSVPDAIRKWFSVDRTKHL